MKIIVAVKRVIDPAVKITIKTDGSGIDQTNAKMVINPFDEVAVEEAIRLREAGIASEVIIVSAGNSASADTIRTALAMGADRGILLKTDQILRPLAVAKLLKYVIEQESPGLVLLGKQAIDDDCNQTGQMLAALLGWGQATFASKIKIEGSKAMAVREIDDGLVVLELSLPALVTVDLRMNQPRYASLPNIMKAKRKQIAEIEISTLGIEIKSALTTISVTEPPKRKGGIIVKDAKELVDLLKNEAKVI